MEVRRNGERGGTLEVKSEGRRNHNRRLRTELVDRAPLPLFLRAGEVVSAGFAGAT